MFFLSSTLLPITLFYFLNVDAQTTQTVQVGLEGSFFDPSYVVAQVGDIISFVFSGNIHTVTQSTFEDPCLALPGGFNSGPAGKGTNGTAPVPVWNLQITNASAPIWYFCQGVVPSSHCAAGMVGVINPPNVTAISQFQSAARAVSGTPAPSLAVTLSGIGAFATASPSDVSTRLPLSSSSTMTSSSSSVQAITTVTTVPPSLRSKGTSNIGAIIGGAVGGTLGLVLIFAAFFLVLQQRKSKRRSVILPHGDFPYTPKQPTHNLDFGAVRNTQPNILNPSRPDIGQAISRSNPHTALSAPTPRRPQFALAHQLENPEASRSTVSPQTRALLEPQSNINIQSLAQEVAVVLRQNPGLAGAAGGELQNSHSGTGSNVDGESSESRAQDRRRLEFHVENRGDRNQDHGYGVMHPPPPHYRSPSGEGPPSRER